MMVLCLCKGSFVPYLTRWCYVCVKVRSSLTAPDTMVSYLCEGARDYSEPAGLDADTNGDTHADEPGRLEPPNEIDDRQVPPGGGPNVPWMWSECSLDVVRMFHARGPYTWISTYARIRYLF
jgi:hypothetical protein